LRLAPIRAFDVVDPEFAWIIDIEWRTMRVWVLRGDLTRSVGVFGRNRTHRHHHRAAKRPNSVRCAVGAERGDIAAALEVPEANAGMHKSFFE
jgi:hypothetical protein